MKRNLLTVSALVMGLTATYAQNASTWQVGDEITDQIEWGNLKFEDPNFTPWQLDASKGSFTKEGGLFEVYDGADVDLYQYVKLPAGKYRMEAQAYYRFGNSWAEEPTQWNAGTWEALAQMYVSNGTYNIDDNSFAVNRTFQTPVMPRLFDASSTQIYADPNPNEVGWDRSDNTITLADGSTVYAPASVPGSLEYFKAGLYAPREDEENEVTYNSVTFFLPTEGYARVGITKKDAKEADSFMATNFKMYYEGQAGEAEELMMLQDDVMKLLNDIEDVADRNPGLLQILAGDDVLDFDGNPAEMTKEECIEAKATLTEIYTKALNAEKYVAKLGEVLPTMKALADKNYPGRAVFEAAIAEAEKCLDVNYEPTEEDSYDTFEKAYNDLLNARMPYLLSQEKVNGAIDMSAAISYPWFCLPEFEPTWNAEEGKWEPNAAALATVGKSETDGEGNEVTKTWDELDDCNGTAANIALGINVYNKIDTPNAWAQGGSGGNLEVYWNDKLTCLKKWSMPFEGLHEISQVVTNVPDGWYSLTALGQTWTNDWTGNCNCHIFIESGDNKDESAPVEIGGWWGTDINQWKQLSTGMINVTNGQIKIGSLDNGFWAVTGFQLKYYGDTPDFSALLAEDVATAKANVESLTWLGDVAAAQALLDKVPTEMPDEAAFLAAKEQLKAVNEYVSAAKAVTSNFDITGKYNKLANEYEEGVDPEYDIIQTAWLSLLDLGNGENDTYLDAEKANKTYDAYVSYIDFRKSLGEYAKNAEIAKLIEEQNEALIANYATIEQLAGYQSAIGAVYNKVVLMEKGFASATEENPTDATVLLVNPDFEEGSKGWTGQMTNNQDGPGYFGVPECYNMKIDVKQTVYGLPAGYYRVQAQVFYRDGGDASASYNHWKEASWDADLWAEAGYANLSLYANDRAVKVRPLGSEIPTEYMTTYIDSWVDDEEAVDDNGNPIKNPHYAEQADPENPSFSYPWDTKVTDGEEEVYYYPNSIWGTKNLFTNHPEMYINFVDVYVKEGGSLTFGLKKDEVIGNDWTMFDNFKLFYLGTETPTGINSTEAAQGAAEGIYTISGVKTNSLSKGINIIKTADGTVKKVVK